MDKKLLYIFFIYLVFEGAFRKWLLPSLSTELFLIKDLLVLGASMGYFARTIKYRTIAPPVITRCETLLICGWIVLCVGYIPLSGFSLTTVIGIRYYLVMIPVMLMLPNIITDLSELNRLSHCYLWLALPVALLGIVQYSSPPDALVNRYAWQSASMGVATIGEKTRITGTFSYISPYTVYLQFIFLVALAQFNLTERGRTRTLIGLIAALLFINIVMSGSRAPFLTSVILAVPFIIDIFRSAGRKSISSLATFLVMGLFFLLFGNAFSLLSERNVEAEDSESRIIGALLTPIVTLRDANFVGAGLGATFMGGKESGGSSESAGFDEVNADRIGVETGIYGYLFVIIFKLFFLGKALALYLKPMDKTIKTWALVVFGYQVSFLWTIPVYNSVAAAFYFACIGLYFFLRKQQYLMINSASNYSEA